MDPLPMDCQNGPSHYNQVYSFGHDKLECLADVIVEYRNAMKLAGYTWSTAQIYGKQLTNMISDLPNKSNVISYMLPMPGSAARTFMLFLRNVPIPHRSSDNTDMMRDAYRKACNEGQLMDKLYIRYMVEVYKTRFTISHKYNYDLSNIESNGQLILHGRNNTKRMITMPNDLMCLLQIWKSRNGDMNICPGRRTFANALNRILSYSTLLIRENISICAKECTQPFYKELDGSDILVVVG